MFHDGGCVAGQWGNSEGHDFVLVLLRYLIPKGIGFAFGSCGWLTGWFASLGNTFGCCDRDPAINSAGRNVTVIEQDIQIWRGLRGTGYADEIHVRSSFVFILLGFAKKQYSYKGMAQSSGPAVKAISPQATGFTQVQGRSLGGDGGAASVLLSWHEKVRAAPTYWLLSGPLTANRWFLII